MVASAVKRADYFVEFTKVQAGSQTAIQKFRHSDFWRGRRLMLVVILKTALAAVVQEFAAGKLRILWRQVSTATAIHSYLDDRNTFYRVKLAGSVENPDHRITCDVQVVVDYVVELCKVLPEHAWKFVGLTQLMWSTSRIACLLLWGYALGGTWLTRRIFERNLARCESAAQAIEAHLRYKLVRVAECAEGIAFHGAAPEERRQLLGALGVLASAQRRLLTWTSGFQAFQEPYNRVATMLPSLVTAPLFWQGHIEFGAISKMFTSFRAVKEILLFAANQYDKLAFIAARLERLEALRRFSALPPPSMQAKITSISRLRTAGNESVLLKLRGVRVSIPSSCCAAAATVKWLGRPGGISLELAPGDSVLIRGESGVGKSSLLRAIAGLWGEGEGEIFATTAVFFVPQTPYLPAGSTHLQTSLREQLLYPGSDGDASDAELCEALSAVGLSSLAGSLAQEADWVATLSGGERQRLVFARLLAQLNGVSAPLVLLDEAASACSEPMEDKMYTALKQLLHAKGGALVSVGHRSSLRSHHDLEVELHGADGGTGWASASLA